MSTDAPVNLNKHRKAKARAEARAKSDENAVKFGRTKAQRLLEAAQSEKARAMLDAKMLDEHE